MNYSHLNATQARQLIRSGMWRRPTTGLTLGYVQANLVILPQHQVMDWSDAAIHQCTH
jgi:uncharacterized protein YcsI (UPF0317 family)